MNIDRPLPDNRDYVSHLVCSLTGDRLPHDRMRGLSASGAPLLVEYDIAAIAKAVDRDALSRRPPDMWMWRELLPIPPDARIFRLGEQATPLVPLPEEGADPGSVCIKDEGHLPTGSFKARGMAVAVAMAKHFGARVLAVPTAGNAGAAAAAYGAAAGLDVHVVAPIDTPEITLRETAMYGARVEQVDGFIDACGQVVRRAVADRGWHDLSTLAEPYRLEGKKTIGLELAHQFNWSLPDVIYYPTGGGTGFIGMWKAFKELQRLGWIGARLPRMVSVQTDGCSPVKQALERGQESIETAWSPVTTAIPGVRVPKPLGGRLILQVIRDSGGHACSVADETALAVRAELAAHRGIHLCPEGAICVAALRDDLAAGRVGRDEKVVIFNTATGYKWPIPDPAGDGAHEDARPSRP